MGRGAVGPDPPLSNGWLGSFWIDRVLAGGILWTMQMIRSPRVLQRTTLRWRREGLRVALVPTMGCLHEGHLSLVRLARNTVGARGRIIVSVYVNPTQFGPREDYASYPRTLKEDLAQLRAEGVDVAFTPNDAAMYPDGTGPGSGTFVTETRRSRLMEGVSRPDHFRGVTTVVAKLFLIAQPEVAVFGAKDYQQAVVIRQMVRDLHFPVRIQVAPTVRAPDGLALSSRNRYLSPVERKQATLLYRSIRMVRQWVRQAPGGIPARVLRARLARSMGGTPGVDVDYIEFFHPQTLDPVARVGRETHMALAMRVGRTRLIDNGRL